MIMMIVRLIVAIGIAFLVGKLVSKIKLPSILGWLIAGMFLGPHALNILNAHMLDAVWYEGIVHVLECAVGLMIGTELVFNKLKKSGKQIVIITLLQSLGTFAVVSVVFAIIFAVMDIPLYLAVVFGAIALATAPAPALSIVREFKTDGPVTRTLIPMAALDDIVGVIVFFTTISIISANVSKGSMPIYMIPVMVILPIIIGIGTGFIAGKILKRTENKNNAVLILSLFIIISSAIGFLFNNVILPAPLLNFMLIGMAFSATFANIVTEEQLEAMMQGFNPILGFAMIIVILNLGAPLDYHLIIGAGFFTIVYIVSRAIGKYGCAFMGSKITHVDVNIKKYLGLTLLPHSGVSLVFTGIAVSTLTGPAPECAKIIQGTIAAAAVINEVIAVVISKKAFEWAGEFHRKEG